MKTKHFVWLIFALSIGITGLRANQVRADQGFYVVDPSTRTGMVMSVSQNDKNVAEPAIEETAPALVGVLGDQPTSFDIQDGQKNILTGGVRDTLVSTINGDIKKGDYITASFVRGIGAKLNGSGWVIGIAQSDFDSSSAGAVATSVDDQAGSQRTVHIGKVPVLIKVLYYDDSEPLKERDISFIPESFQSVIDSIAGKRASQMAVLMAGILLLAGLLIAGIIVYSAIKNGIVSTARQPLAKQAIVRRMVESCLIALGIIIISIFGALVIIRII